MRKVTDFEVLVRTLDTLFEFAAGMGGGATFSYSFDERVRDSVGL
jgi:hypothetical protein